jgi:Ca2+-binding RTX toxin-like protein
MVSMFWLGARGRFAPLWSEPDAARGGEMGLRLLDFFSIAASRASAAPRSADSSGSLSTQSSSEPVFVWAHDEGPYFVYPHEAPAAVPPVMAGRMSPGGGNSYGVLFSDGSSAVVDGRKGEMLQGGLGDHKNLTGGDDDQIVIGGDIGPLTLDGVAGFERIVLLAGSSYELTADDRQLGRGETLAVSATALGAGDSLRFDGSAERDGSFLFHGGAGADSFTGGSGADVLYGLGGADRLEGGGGADRFVYTAVSESSGSGYDTIVGFNFAEDKIDLHVGVTGLAAAVNGGKLSIASFDADLAALLGGTKLGAGQALFFTASAGDLAGKAFLVVDANGKAGYQPGEDFVIHFDTAPAADLSGAAFIV